MAPDVMALPSGMQRFAWATLAREPWRNGKGWTRTVAQQGESDALAWRVSLAEVTQASPFSTFAGLDRISVLAQGGPLTLQNPDEHRLLSHVGDQARYPGELPLHNTLPTNPARIWNVMTRRGHAAADVTLHREGPMRLPTDGHALLWVIAGECALVGDALPLGLTIQIDEGLQGGGAAWRGLHAHVRGAQALCLLTHLHA
jgi:environmental stress-induced protein Ves